MLSPEKRLLLQLCRIEPEWINKSAVTSIAEEVTDWTGFVNLANKHGIIALIANNLKETGTEYLVPEVEIKRLSDGLMQNILRNAWLIKRWKEINAVLTTAGIKHLLIKGMALEHSYYGSAGLRQMSDIDILVKEQDALKAWHMLQEKGFKACDPKSSLHKKIISYIGKHLPALVSGGLSLEIHSRLFNEKDKNKSLVRAFDSAREILIDGTRAFIPEDDLHLEYLLEHNMEHLSATGPELKLFLDISILKKDNYISISEDILSKPGRYIKPLYRKEVYRHQFYSLPPKFRLRFLTGDLFPSTGWMKQRHHIKWPLVLLFYPRRLGKLLWLLK